MSLVVLPDEERHYGDSFPDLNIEEELEIKVKDDDRETNSDTQSVERQIGNVSKMGSRSNADIDNKFDIKESNEAPFSVPSRVGGIRDHPSNKLRKLTHQSQIPAAKALSKEYEAMGYVPLKSHPRNSKNYGRPSAQLDAYEPFVVPPDAETLKHPPDFYRLLSSPSLRVEYSLDEPDLAIIGLLAMRYRISLTPEQLEVIFSMLTLCASQIALRAWIASGNSANIDSNAACMVCCLRSFSDTNSIIFCDGCDIAVHQECYGVPSVPEGLWYCRRCEAKHDHGANYDVSCALCPFRSGAFKRTMSNKWVHMVCALWTPTIRVPSETALLEPVRFLELVDPKRFSLRCYVCRRKYGACIQCASKECYKAFHPMCAQISGFYMTKCGGDMSEMLKNQEYLPVYCDRHSIKMYRQDEKERLDSLSSAPAPAPAPVPPSDPSNSPIASLSGGLTLPLDSTSGMEYVRLFLRSEHESPATPPSDFGSPRYPCWRTPRTKTLVLPNAVINPVKNSLKERIDLDISIPALEFLCRYWTIKCDVKNGVMFNRRLYHAIEVAAMRVLRVDQKHYGKSDDPPKLLIGVADEILRILKK